VSFAARYPNDERVLEALVGVAGSLYYMEKYDEALTAYGDLLAHPSFSPSVLGPEERYSMAETCFRTKDYRCAKVRFTEFYNLYPQDERGDEALARMGDVYKEMGEDSTALAFYQEAVALYPGSDGAAISTIRMADLSVEKPEIARRLAVMSPEFEPMDSYDSVANSDASKLLTELAHYKKAQLLSLRGQHSEAIEEFQRLRKKYPTGNLVEHSRAAAVEVLQQVVQDYLARGEEFLAIEAYLSHKGLVKTTDFQPYALYTLVGRAYLRNHMPGRAAELFKQVVEVEFPTPSDEEASWLLGKAYAEDGALEEADRQLRTFIASYPKSRYGREARFTLGKTLFSSKRFTEALGSFESEVSLAEPAPFSLEALLFLARTHKALARREQAVMTYEKLLSKEEDKVSVREPWRRLAAFELSDLLFEMDSFGKALAAYQEAVKLYPEDHRLSWAELQIARAYQRLGRKQEASEAYKSLASQEGESLWSQVAAEYREAVKVTP
jgi:TolA-binding protein